MTLHVRDHNLLQLLTLIISLAATNQDNIVWLASQLLPLSCYCIDHSHLSHTMFFIKWDRLLSCFMIREPPSIIQCTFMLPKSVHKHQTFILFMLLRLFDIFIAATSHVLETKGAYYSKKLILTFVMILPVAVNHTHKNSTVYNCNFFTHYPEIKPCYTISLHNITCSCNTHNKNRVKMKGW